MTSNAVAAQPKSKPQLAVGARGVSAIIPQDFEQAYRLATAIAAAGWAPKSYLVDDKNPAKGYDANKIVIGILHGMEVGLTPMASLQSIAVINGTPNLWGDGLLAVVRASGLLKEFDEWEEKTDEGLTAHCFVWREGETKGATTTFSEADAKKAGLSGKAGPWTNYPKRMRKMRARSEGLRDKFADVLRGMKSAEEALDGGDLIPGEDGTYVPSRPRPQRSDFAGGGAASTVVDVEDEPQDPFVFTDADGEVRETTNEDEFTSWLVDALGAESDERRIEALWENSSQLERLRAINPKLADEVHEAYSMAQDRAHVNGGAQAQQQPETPAQALERIITELEVTTTEDAFQALAEKHSKAIGDAARADRDAYRGWLKRYEAKLAALRAAEG